MTAPHWMTTLNRSLSVTRRSFSAMSRWPVEEMGMNSVNPSTIPRIRAIIQCGMNYFAADLFFPAEERRFAVALLDFELSQNRVPADVNFVPAILDAAQVAFAHLAQVAQRRRVADERDNFFLGGRRDFDGGKNNLQILRDDAFEFEEADFVVRAEFFGAGDVDEMVELFPALDVRLGLADQLFNLGAHGFSPAGDDA